MNINQRERRLNEIGNLWAFPFTTLLQSLWYVAGIVGIWELVNRIRATGQPSSSTSMSLLDVAQFAIPIAALITWNLIFHHVDLWIVVFYTIGASILFEQKTMQWFLLTLSPLLLITFFINWRVYGFLSYSLIGGSLSLFTVSYLLYRKYHPYWAAMFSATWIIVSMLIRSEWLHAASEMVSLFGFTIPLFIYFTEKYLHKNEAQPNLHHPTNLSAVIEGQPSFDEFRNTILQLPVGIIITTQDYIIVDINDEFTKFSGYAKSQLLGKKPSMMAAPQATNHELYESMKNRLLTEGYWDGEFLNRKPTGEIWNAHTTISPLRINDSQFGYWAVVIPIEQETYSQKSIADSLLIQAQ